VARTDKTRPWQVKVKEYEVKRPRHVDRELGWTYWTYEWWRGEFRCGCKTCGYDAFETPRRKKQRTEGKRQTRDWLREY
jgi:hypothetical protein